MKKLFFLFLALLLAAVAALAALVYRWAQTPYGRLHPLIAVLSRLLQSVDSGGVSDDNLAQVRRQMDRVKPRIPVGSVIDHTIAGPHGPLPLRIYTPQGNGSFPVLVYLHGGGFALGSVASHENVTRRIARDARVIVVSVEYCLAPENPFPAPLEDAYTAVRWVADNAHTFGGEATKLAVGGDSAGGNLAAAVALMARDKGGPSLGLQVLLYPALTMVDDEGESRRQHEGYILTAADMRQFRDWYLPDENDWRNPYVSPLEAPDLHGLPPAYIMTAAFDPLRDDGYAYAERLRAAGVPVTYRNCEGMVHGFLHADDFLAFLPGDGDWVLREPALVYADITAAVDNVFRSEAAATPHAQPA